MPRTLPWLAQGGVKKDKKETTATSRTPRPQQARQRSSSPADLVNSDLDDIPGSESPAREDRKQKGKRKPFDRSPSTSPAPVAPAAPEVEYMNEGFDADDIYMMVEDEFDSTARLFTQHIHQAEYQRLRRLHRSRGEETLRKLGHGTDGRTPQSRALRLKLEAQERAQKDEFGEDSESESDDEYKRDPQLAGLMTASQRAKSGQDVSGLAKAKSTTRAAAGYAQSPRKGNKWKKDIPGGAASQMPRMSPVVEDGSTEDDEYDLDAPMRDPKPKPRPVAERSSSGQSEKITKPKSTGFFKPFAKPRADEEDDSRPASKSSTRSSSSSREPSSDRKLAQKSNGTSRSPAIKAEPKDDRSARVAEILARRRQQTQQTQESPVKVKQEVKIKEEPHSQSTTSSKPKIGEQKHKQVVNSPKLNQKLETKSSEKEKSKKRSRADDIPMFLF